MADKSSVGPTWSTAELWEKIEGLSESDQVRLRKVAAAYARACPLEAGDLLQEAFLRALDGRRRCPCNVSVVKFLAESVRSIAWAANKEVKSAPRFVSIDAEEMNPSGSSLNIADVRPIVDEVMMNIQEHAKTVEKLRAMFSDDENAMLILEGEMDGMTANELRELTGLDATSYASKRRLIRRRIDKEFVPGSTND